jgi:hypothetical protein
MANGCDALQVKPLVRLNFPTTLSFKCIVSRYIEYEVTINVSTVSRPCCLQPRATHSLTTRSLQFMLRAFCSDTNLEASKPVSSSTSRTWTLGQHIDHRIWTRLGKFWRTAHSISDSFRESFPFGNPQELKAFVIKCTTKCSKAGTLTCCGQTPLPEEQKSGWGL